MFGDAKEQLIIGLIQDNHLMINTHRLYKTGKANLFTQYSDIICRYLSGKLNDKKLKDW